MPPYIVILGKSLAYAVKVAASRVTNETSLKLPNIGVNELPTENVNGRASISFRVVAWLRIDKETLAPFPAN